MIAPVIPPQSPLQELIHGPQVTNRVVRPADGDVVYGLGTVGDGGRVLDKITFAALDWRPGTSLELTCLDAGVLLARPTSDGAIVITAGGYFRIPYRLRRQVSLFIGNRASTSRTRGVVRGEPATAESGAAMTHSPHPRRARKSWPPHGCC